VAKVPRARHRARMSAEERLGEYGNDAAWLGRRRVRRFGEKLCFPEGKAVRFEQRSCTRAFRDISPEGYRQSVDGVNRASTLRSIWTFIVGRRPLVRIRAAGAKGSGASIHEDVRRDRELTITGPGGAEPVPLPFGRRILGLLSAPARPATCYAFNIVRRTLYPAAADENVLERIIVAPVCALCGEQSAHLFDTTTTTTTTTTIIYALCPRVSEKKKNVNDINT